MLELLFCKEEGVQIALDRLSLSFSELRLLSHVFNARLNGLKLLTTLHLESFLQLFVANEGLSFDLPSNQVAPQLLQIVHPNLDLT